MDSPVLPRAPQYPSIPLLLERGREGLCCLQVSTWMGLPIIALLETPLHPPNILTDNCLFLLDIFCHMRAEFLIAGWESNMRDFLCFRRADGLEGSVYFPLSLETQRYICNFPKVFQLLDKSSRVSTGATGACDIFHQP